MRAISGLLQVESGKVFATSRPTLLSVGAALMPSLSGERNILLGGMALGSTRQEMVESVDGIAKFAGLEEFIDMPMRTYSSGMAARLRFSIAQHKDHEILIIDEALAVGDKQFRNRSEARVREMRDRAGTVFLVSHSMASILDTCNRVIWLEKGELRMDGDPKEVTDAYTEYMESISKPAEEPA
jgi:teichoic acid transport system ATP-binding protein